MKVFTTHIAVNTRGNTDIIDITEKVQMQLEARLQSHGAAISLGWNQRTALSRQGQGCQEQRGYKKTACSQLIHSL